MRDNYLTPQRYDQLEDEAIRRYSPYLVREFIPITFSEYGFQSRIKHVDELWKFADSQQEFRYNSNISELLGGGITKEEFEFVKKITNFTVNFTENFGKPIVGRNALTRALVVFRAICALSEKGKKPRILEIGPGSGYLAMLCRLKGFAYYSTDVTQSLYLFQNNYWNFCFPEQLHECLDDHIPVADFVHIPWWVWANNKVPLPSFDFVTINHAVNEISPKGFMYAMRRISESLTGSMLIEGWGGGRFESNFLTLSNFGAEFKHQQFSTAGGYMPLAVLNIQTFSAERCSVEIKQDSTIGVKQESTINFLRRHLPSPIKSFLRAIGITRIYSLFLRHRQTQKIKYFYRSHLSDFSNKLRVPKNDVFADQLQDFYNKYRGHAELITPDEEFGDYIGSRAHLILE